MKYSKLCPYSCIHCQGKLKRKSLFNRVEFYCTICYNTKGMGSIQDKEIGSQFVVTYEEDSGNLVLATIDLGRHILQIVFRGQYALWCDTTTNDNLKTVPQYKIPFTAFDLTNKARLLEQLKFYLVFA